MTVSKPTRQADQNFRDSKFQAIGDHQTDQLCPIASFPYLLVSGFLEMNTLPYRYTSVLAVEVKSFMCWFCPFPSPIIPNSPFPWLSSRPASTRQRHNFPR